MRAGERHDVTGEWLGIFAYPRLLPPSNFRARLREAGGFVSGEIDEPCDHGPAKGQVIHALMVGRRAARSIDLEKRYDDLDRADYVVVYRGELNGDGTEITGRWDIAGVWSGSFIMVREIGIAVADERRVAETIDR